ncbi:MAG TPA: hypothetical protein VI365_22505 [Trebonia sp.]
MLVPSAQTVVAFRTSAADVGQGAGTVRSAPRAANPSPGPVSGGPMIAGIALGCLAAAGATGWFIWFTRRRRRT